jgi:hypothetical protein
MALKDWGILRRRRSQTLAPQFKAVRVYFTNKLPYQKFFSGKAALCS